MAMKESGIEWVGLIPDDWKIAKNNRLFNISKQLVNENWKNTQLLSLTKSGIIEKNINDGGGKQPESFGTYQYVEKDDIVLCLFDIDVSAVFSDRSKYDGMISPAYRVMKCTDAILPVYAKWWFDAVNIGRYYLIYTKSLRKTIDADGFGNILTVVPPLSEQQAIADYLDETCSKIDEIIAEAKASIDEYKELKQSVIFEAVTKGLDKNVEMKDSGVEWIGEIPESWNIRMLNQYVSQVKCKNSDLSETNLLSLSYGKIKRKNINSNDGLLPESFDNYNVVDENDIVLRLTDLQNDHKSLRVGLVTERGIITSAYVTIRPNGINAAYLALLLHAFDYKKGFYGMGSGIRQGLTFDGIKSLKIVVPSNFEQDDIVKHIMKMTEKCDSLISEKESLINDLEAYKKSLIYEVVTGKRRVV